MEDMKKASSFTVEPRLLTGEEQRVWCSYVHATTLLEDHMDRHLQREAGMPQIYYGLLVNLAESPHQRLQMTELAMHTKITRSRLSHAVTRLEKNGLVRRDFSSSDGRGKFTVLTEHGLDVLRQSAPGHATAVRNALFDRLSFQQQQSLGEIMQTVADGLQMNKAGADLPWLR